MPDSLSLDQGSKEEFSEKEIEIFKKWFDFCVGDIYQPSKDEWRLAKKIGAYKGELS